MATKKNKVSPGQGTLPFDDLVSSNGTGVQEPALTAGSDVKKSGETLDKLLTAAELKQLNDQKAAEGRLAKRKFTRIKARVMKFERTNNSRILVFASGANWYKICGNSALIYAHIIAPKLGRTVNIRNDTDFEHKSREGIVSIKYIDLLKKDLQSVGVEIEDEDEDMVLFALDKPLSKAELKAIQHVEEDKINRVNQIVRTKDLYPSLTALARNIAHRFYSWAKAGDKTAQVVILNELARKAIGSVTTLLLVANGFEQAERSLAAIQIKNEHFKGSVLLLMELNIITSEQALKMEADLAEFGVQLDAELRKINGGRQDATITQGERVAEEAAETGLPSLSGGRLRDGNADGGTGYVPGQNERVAGESRYIPGGGGFKNTTRVR